MFLFSINLKKRLLIILAFSILCSSLFSGLFSGPAFAAARYAVIKNLANIRSGPGTKYEIVCEAAKYYPLNYIKKSGNWYRVKDFEGDVGWIHKSLVQKMSAIITTKPKCNIRSGPGTKYKIKFVSTEGVPFKVLKRQGQWIKVRHSEGHEGWLHKSLVW